MRDKWGILKNKFIEKGLCTTDICNLIKYAKKSRIQGDNIYQLLNLVLKEFQKDNTVREIIDNLLQYTDAFLNTNDPEDNRVNKSFMRVYSRNLDSSLRDFTCPDWLKACVGIVLSIVVIALLLTAIALIISLTGGSVAALIAPAIALLNPIVGVVAGISIAGLSIGTLGATATLAGTSTLCAGIAGLCGFFIMKKSSTLTVCVEKIIQDDSFEKNMDLKLNT